MKRTTLFAASVAFLAACGGGEPADSTPGDGSAPAAPAPAASTTTAPSGPMTVPAWIAIDEDARTVSMTITAGETNVNNYWNMNGAIRGELAITVPEGYTVTIDFVNDDPNMAHSLGVSAETSSFAVPPATEPVFAGAMTKNPTSMIDATMPGESETITFVADAAGNYSLVCYIPGHSAVGMWLYFNVSAEGESGVQGL